ncbi:MAG TPA: hypothetical protein VI356_17670 [Myxococcales bacterium]
MAIQKLTLWLLNRVVGWEKDFLLSRLRFNDRFHVKIGRRVRAGSAAATDQDFFEMPVNEGEDGRDGELMHEGSAAYDEYFMPIPLKCAGGLGSDFWKANASPDGLSRLAELGEHLARRFPADRPFDPAGARAAVGPFFGDVRMNFQDKSLGYYELLRRTTDATGAQNVLIGYSQGGTVARYLAFLDEHVVKPERRCIHAVITVQSPNRGSPVAAKAKEADVGRAMLGILLALSGWIPKDDFRASEVWSFLTRQQQRNTLVAFVNGLLDAELRTWPESEQNRRLRETWISARKWASGLSGLEDLAFWDLDPARMAEAGSVLHAIATWPLRTIQHGAVIGTDNGIHNLVDAAIHGSAWYIPIAAGAVEDKVRQYVGQAEDIYNNDAMSFPPGTAGTVADEYLQGIDPGRYKLDGALPKGAHDFVIPSASQLLVPADSPCHIGNLVNPKASHLSGAMRWAGEDAPNDEELVGVLLDRLSPAPGFDVPQPTQVVA